MFTIIIIIIWLLYDTLLAFSLKTLCHADDVRCRYHHYHHHHLDYYYYFFSSFLILFCLMGSLGVRQAVCPNRFLYQYT